MARKVAVITGGNSGIGYGIAQRLLDDPPYPHFTIVLACRNLQRADEARASLLAAHAAELLERDDDQATTKPDVDVQVLQLDTSRPASVLAAARDIRRRFATLDYLFCNAGILPASSIAYLRAAYYIFSAPHYFITSSVALNQVRGQLTPEGLGLVFATNAFGHYLLIRTLEPYLFNRPADHGSEGDGTRIIWTSSNTSAHIGSTGAFRPDDYQHIEGPNPYESSKMIGDTVSMYLNQRYADKPVWSFITEPGTVASNIYAEIGNWLLSLIIVLVNYAVSGRQRLFSD
ncbi:3-keto-steroid reductase [Tieghemiomyces parasiticus]|uniref:3-keto-steroid reductase n=1 Tax=Tieghemiomyces parasiticus TaxID=78921 RepID=A0A9W8AD13_9FUNG|nr:3-keto-steroid reductase [Tieghemiomyces parasiticus]